MVPKGTVLLDDNLSELFKRSLNDLIIPLLALHKLVS